MTKHKQPSYQPAGKRAVDLAEALEDFLSSQLRILESEESAVIEGKDPEALHRFRVALRKSRAVLAEFKPWLIPEMIHLRQQMTAIARVTGDCRDADVFMESLAQDQVAMPPDFHPGMERLQRQLQIRRRSAHQEVVAMIQSASYQALKSDWRQWLEQPAVEWLSVTQLSSLKKLLRDRIHHRVNKVAGTLARLKQGSAEEEIHAFRIMCKKLRYLLEFTAIERGDKKVDKAIQVLKRFQNYLGEYHDAGVQAAWLLDFLETETQDVQTAASIGWLLAVRKERQRRNWKKLLKRRRRLENLERL